MAKRSSSRRDFLLGRTVWKAARDAASQRVDADAADAEASTAAVGGSYLVTVSRQAMGGHFEISLNAGQYAEGTAVALETLDLVEQLERRLSYFRAESEVARVNRDARDTAVRVSSELFALLQYAAELSRSTGGALDITAAPLWKLWGFARREGTLPEDSRIDAALQAVGMHAVELDGEARTVRFLRPEMQMTLASIGKGYAIDCCARRLAESGIDDYLMHGGGSSILARGSRLGGRTLAGHPIAAGWSIGVAHPLRPGKRLAEIILRDEAVGTSGSATQFFRHGGRRYSHILDPRTGRPAEGLYSVTVLAPSALEADALSTAFFVLGAEAALAYCESRPHLSALLVVQTPRAPGFEVVRHGFDDDRLVWHENW